MVKKATAVEVMTFFEKFTEFPKAPSRQAFSKSREKINYLAIKDFFDKSCELAIEGEGAKVYKGYRVLAVDGTSFFVGEVSIKSLKEYFGESTTVKGKAMCRISGIVDVLNECIINAAVSAFETGERALAIKQTEKLACIENALYLFDRGYWSPELVKTIAANGQKFLMRLASNTGNAIAKDENGSVIPLRRYSFTLPNGIVETLLTNLPVEEVSDLELQQLYAKRWGVETKYLELKSRLEIENLSGCSANTVLQDIYATLYISNLTAFLCFEANEIIVKKTIGKNNKYLQKANRSNGISLLRDRFINICLLEDPIQQALALNRLVKDISANVVYVGKSKSRPRDKRKIKVARSRSSHNSVL